MSTQAFFPTMSPPQGLLTFPESLTSKYQPRYITDFVGLEKPREIVSAFAYAPREGRALIFVGPPGSGKTSMGLALANELKAELHHIPSQNCNLDTLSRVRYSCNLVPMGLNKRHLVLIDEADMMSNAAQTALLSELDGTDASPLTNFVFTCNSTERFERRFLTRCRVVEFSSYGVAKAAADRLEYIWDAETQCAEPKPNFARIVKECNNSVRDAIVELETAIDLYHHRRHLAVA